MAVPVDEFVSALGGSRQARDGQTVAEGSQAAAIKWRAAQEKIQPATKTLRHKEEAGLSSRKDRLQSSLDFSDASPVV